MDQVVAADWLEPDDVVARALDAHARGRASIVVVPDVSVVRSATRSVRRALGRVPLLRELRRRGAGPRLRR